LPFYAIIKNAFGSFQGITFPFSAGNPQNLVLYFKIYAKTITKQEGKLIFTGLTTHAARINKKSNPRKGYDYVFAKQKKRYTANAASGS